jgi:hypothetical protein
MCTFIEYGMQLLILVTQHIQLQHITLQLEDAYPLRIQLLALLGELFRESPVLLIDGLDALLQVTCLGLPRKAIQLQVLVLPPPLVAIYL